MPTLEAPVFDTSEADRPLPVEFHSDAEFRDLLDHAYANGVRALTCETPAADQTVRQLAARAGVICPRRVRDGVAKWVLFLPRREES